jgi:formylglycine-generating enzyme required for sulfatase activity
VITSTPTQISTPTATILPAEITDAKGVQMILIPAGEFTMGSNTGDGDEKPVHKVYLDAYYMDKLEVTNVFYSACVSADACKPPTHKDAFTRSSYYGNPQYDDYPVVYVNWDMAKTYCEWRGARLPTEAEWEKAARGTDAPTYPWGQAVECQKANYQACIDGTSPAGYFEDGKSPYGVYDMAGNVWEWVADWYSENYYGISLRSNPLGPDSGQARVMRGGSWTRSEYDIRTSNRIRYASTYDNFDVGFRCAMDVTP